MATPSTKVRILLIRPWTEPLAPIRQALDTTGLDVRIIRVDLEPALDGALARGNYDLVLLDPATKDITLEIVEARLRDHRRLAPIVVLPPIDELVATIRDVLARRWN